MIGAREISEYAQKYNMKLGKDTPLSMEWCFKMADKAYEKGRAEGYSKAENDYFAQSQKDREDTYNCGYAIGRRNTIDELYDEIFYIENKFRSMVNNINQEDDLIKWIDLNGKLTAITTIKHLIGDKLKERKE